MSKSAYSTRRRHFGEDVGNGRRSSVDTGVVGGGIDAAADAGGVSAGSAGAALLVEGGEKSLIRGLALGRVG